MIIYLCILSRRRNVSDKLVEIIKTHILCPGTFFSENHAVYEIMWKNIVQPDDNMAHAIYADAILSSAA